MTTKTVSLSLAMALLAASGLSQATSAWHQGNGDVVHVTPEHIGRSTAKSPMAPDVHAQMAHGELMASPLAQMAGEAPGAGPTRQQVVRELLTQTAEERGRMKRLYAN